MSQAINHEGLSERVAKIKERFLNSPYAVDIERARSYPRAWKRTEGLGPARRAAEGLAEALRNQTIRIEDDELLVGVKSVKRRGNVVAVEKGTFNGQVGMFTDPDANPKLRTAVGGTTSVRVEQFVKSVPAGEAREWQEDILPYWSNRTVAHLKRKMIEDARIFKGLPSLGPATLYRVYRGLGGWKGISATMSRNKAVGDQDPQGEVKSVSYRKRSGMGALKKSLSGTASAKGTLQDLLPDLLYMSLSVQGHTIPGYKRVLAIGFKGIGDWADKELAELGPQEKEYAAKKDFYESVSLAAKAVCEYSERYAKLGEDMAATAAGPRKSELLAIAERARHVPANPLPCLRVRH